MNQCHTQLGPKSNDRRGTDALETTYGPRPPSIPSPKIREKPSGKGVIIN